MPEQQQGRGLEKSRRAHRFFHERFVVAQDPFVLVPPIGVPAEIQDLDIRLLGPDVRGEFLACHPRHPDIQHIQIEGGVLSDDVQRVDPSAALRTS